MQRVPDKKIYLDYASTTPTDPSIIEDCKNIQTMYFENADSLHYGGQRVSELLRKSQMALAQYFDVLPHEIIFTSGASEANSAAIKGIALALQSNGKHIITSAIEHASVLSSVKQLVDHFGFSATYLGVDEDGCIRLDELKVALRKDTVLVSLMAVNNEVGSVFDIEAAVQIVKRHSNAYFHVDAVQSLARHDISLKQVDAVSYSAHKIYGMKGSGLLILKAGVPFLPLINGGQQQGGLRGGTVDNPKSILFAKTLRLAKEHHDKHFNRIEMMSQWIYDFFANVEGVSFNSTQKGTPYIVNLSIDNIGSEIMMNGLNSSGIAVSAQSTCNSKSHSPSHVLKSMGKTNEQALSSIRISLSHLTQIEDIERTCHRIMEIKNYAKHQV